MPSLEQWTAHGARLDDADVVIENACIAACRKRGRSYTEKVMAETEKVLNDTHDERGKLAVMRLLAKVEALLDQQPLPLDRVAP